MRDDVGFFHYPKARCECCTPKPYENGFELDRYFEAAQQELNRIEAEMARRSARISRKAADIFHLEPAKALKSRALAKHTEADRVFLQSLGIGGGDGA